MSKIQVEVRFTDKLDVSLLVYGQHLFTINSIHKNYL